MRCFKNWRIPLGCDSTNLMICARTEFDEVPHINRIKVNGSNHNFSNAFGSNEFGIDDAKFNACEINSIKFPCRNKSHSKSE